MKSVKVTYRTIEAGPDVAGQRTNVMVVKSAEFKSGTGVNTSGTAGYSLDGSFLRVYGGGKTMLVPKTEVLEVEAEE